MVPRPHGARDAQDRRIPQAHRRRRRSGRRAGPKERPQPAARRTRRPPRSRDRAQSRRSCRSANHQGVGRTLRRARHRSGSDRRTRAAERRAGRHRDAEPLRRKTRHGAGADRRHSQRREIVDHQRPAQAVGGEDGKPCRRYAPAPVVSFEAEYRTHGYAGNSGAEDRDEIRAVEAGDNRRGAAHALRAGGSRQRVPQWAVAQNPHTSAPDLETFASTRFARRGGEVDYHNAAQSYIRALNEGTFGRFSFESPHDE